MTGRGIDQILPHPTDPALREGYVRDARQYVELAEEENGPIPRPVEFSWPWGDTLPLLDEIAPDVRVINLETSVTHSDDFAGGKRVHYRMAPENLPCLLEVQPDCCVLANNHVLDFGPAGLEETLAVLADAGLRTTGAGRDAAEAWHPAIVSLDEDRRVLVFSVGMTTSGVPAAWQATADRPGVAFLTEPNEAGADRLLDRIDESSEQGDLVVASIHWGSNWGYEIPDAQTRFAHRLVQQGVDVVHGHSSHHPRPFEVHDGRLILYGCGDYVNDYEGISGHERYRDELRLAYLVTLDEAGALDELRMVPMRARRMRLEYAPDEDAAWLRDLFGRINEPVDGPEVTLGADGHLRSRSC